MNKNRMSDSEYVIMQVLWEKSPVSSAEIVNRLMETTNWSPKTIHTFLRRLVSKGTVKAEKEGNFYRYSPNISRQEYAAHETKSFVKKIYDGSISSLVMNFIKHEKLPEDELKRLKEMLETPDAEE